MDFKVSAHSLINPFFYRPSLQLCFRISIIKQKILENVTYHQRNILGSCKRTNVRKTLDSEVHEDRKKCVTYARNKTIQITIRQSLSNMLIAKYQARRLWPTSVTDSVMYYRHTVVVQQLRVIEHHLWASNHSFLTECFFQDVE